MRHQLCIAPTKVTDEEFAVLPTDAVLRRQVVVELGAGVCVQGAGLEKLHAFFDLRAASALRRGHTPRALLLAGPEPCTPRKENWMAECCHFYQKN